MKRMLIRLVTIHDMKEFVEAAAEVKGDVDLNKSKYYVDGKSILGVMSLGAGCEILCEYPDDADEFETFITKFKVD